jgi:hypothetical protein
MRLAEPRKAAVSANSTHVGLDGAQLHLPDGSVDCVLSSYTLCTIPDVAAALLDIECSSQRVHCISWSMGKRPRSRYAGGNTDCTRFIAASLEAAILTDRSIN